VTLAVLPLVSSASAHADDTGGLVVDVNGSPVANIAATLEGITPDVASGTYTVVFPAGNQISIPVSNAWYLQTLISAAGATPRSTAQVQVDRVSGGSVRLTPPDYTGATDFLEGPAVVYEHEAGEFWFLRPIRLPAPQDKNSLDWVQMPLGDDLTVHITAGAKLTVHVATSVEHPDAGQSVRFSATSSGQVDGEQLSYDWQFADGFHSAKGPTITHAFAKAGTYNVTLNVDGDHGSGGSAVVHVVVGKAAGAPGPGNNHPGGGSQSGGTNGTHGGTTGNGTAQQSQGASTTPKGQKPKPSPAQQSGGTQIQGYLVSATGSSAQQASSPSQASGPSGTASSPSLTWLRTVGALALALAFFFAGALMESDDARRWWTRTVRRRVPT